MFQTILVPSFQDQAVQEDGLFLDCLTMRLRALFLPNVRNCSPTDTV